MRMTIRDTMRIFATKRMFKRISQRSSRLGIFVGLNLMGLNLMVGSAVQAQPQTNPPANGVIAPSSAPLSNTSFVLGTQQLVINLEQKKIFFNGESLTLENPLKILEGKTMLPLREMAELFNLELQVDDQKVTVGNTATGALSIALDAQTVSFKGQPVAEGLVQLLGDQFYISVRLLSDVLGGTLNFSEDGKTLTLTVLAARQGLPSLPQARFLTNKSRYAQGEPVLITEYSFDPDGLDLINKRWTGRSSSYFVPGDYTLTLQVSNSKGLQSEVFSRSITVTEQKVDTPLSYSLKYAPLGSSISDSSLPYSRLKPIAAAPDGVPLVFSDSPETVASVGILYRDTLSGKVRAVVHHLNALTENARVYLVARNLEDQPITLTSRRLGETAPARFAGTLGQATLMDYFANSDAPSLTLEPGQILPIYTSIALEPGAGMNLMVDLELSGKAEISVLLLADSHPLEPEKMGDLLLLPTDGKHVRGTFAGANRQWSVDLSGGLPAKVVIGDAEDGALLGVDATSNSAVKLAGNYGVVYDIMLQNVEGVVGALAARGGLYKGAIQMTDVQSGRNEVLALPSSGVISNPDNPVLFMRVNPLAQDAPVRSLRLQFVPASGSNLPIHLIFYRPNLPRVLPSPQPQPIPVPEPIKPIPEPAKPALEFDDTFK